MGSQTKQKPDYRDYLVALVLIAVFSVLIFRVKFLLISEGSALIINILPVAVGLTAGVVVGVGSYLLKIPLLSAVGAAAGMLVWLIIAGESIFSSFLLGVGLAFGLTALPFVAGFIASHSKPCKSGS